MTDENSRELTTISKIENCIEKGKEKKVFPLGAMHRKELRELRDKNVGSLRTQMAFIKNEKEKEFEEKYAEEINKRIDKLKQRANMLNEDYTRVAEKIKKLVDKRRELENKNITKNMSINKHYHNEVIETYRVENQNRHARVHEVMAKRDISKKEFEKQYGKAFEKVGSEIDRLNTAYEEAINFGDLEIVKRLYYKFKDAETLLKKIKDMEI